MNDECIDHGQQSRTYGKGLLRKGFRNNSLHRQVFFETRGFLPPVVRHTCDNRRCINPAHLLAGTQKDNLQDRKDRGRAPKTQVTKRKLSFADAEAIRKAYGPGTSMASLAARYGLAVSNIYNVLKGTTYVCQA